MEDIILSHQIINAEEIDDVREFNGEYVTLNRYKDLVNHMKMTFPNRKASYLEFIEECKKLFGPTFVVQHGHHLDRVIYHLESELQIAKESIESKTEKTFTDDISVLKKLPLSLLLTVFHFTLDVDLEEKVEGLHYMISIINNDDYDREQSPLSYQAEIDKVYPVDSKLNPDGEAKDNIRINFMPAKTFEGKKESYIFTTGQQGTGYYLDDFILRKEKEIILKKSRTAINEKDKNWVALKEEEVEELLLALTLTFQMPTNKLVMVDNKRKYPFQEAKEAVVPYLINKTKKELITLENEALKKMKNKDSYKRRWSKLGNNESLTEKINYYNEQNKLDHIGVLLNKYYLREDGRGSGKRERTDADPVNDDSFDEISVDDLVDILSSRTICAWGSCY